MNNFWHFLNRGGRAPQNEKCLSPNVPPGTTLRATDREYVVKASGQWVRKPSNRADIPTTKSQLAFPAVQKKNKYPKVETDEKLLPGSA